MTTRDNDPPKTIAAIDPGLSGALAIVDLSGKLVHLCDLPVIEMARGKRTARELDAWEIHRLFVEHWVAHVVLEQAQARPPIRGGVRLKGGIVSTGAYMQAYGTIIGICGATYCPLTVVTAAIWKREVLTGMGKDKGASILRAKSLYPRAVLDHKKDHHKAEALLIAWYGLHHILHGFEDGHVLSLAAKNRS
jgi:hypothetical protein